MDITAVASAMTSLKAAADVAKAVVELNTSLAVTRQVGEVYRHMVEAQQAIFEANEERAALIQRVHAMEGELARVKEWEREKEDYQLQELVPGILAYAPKPGMQVEQPPHHLCPQCYEANAKSYLQGETRQDHAGPERKTCPRCGLALEYQRRDLPKREKPRNPNSGR